MRFIARASKSSGLQGYWLTFFIFAQGLQKTLSNWPKLAAAAAAATAPAAVAAALSAAVSAAAASAAAVASAAASIIEVAIYMSLA